MRTIAIVNQKGGCGKTTTAINLAAVLARRGLRTLLVDTDPQSHCATGLGVPDQRIDHGVAEALLHADDERFDPTDVIWEVGGNLDLLPSTMRLAGLEAPGGGLHELPDRDRRMSQLLARMADRYDRCLIDCPPTIGLLTFNALRAAREALIPVETGFFALRGADKQWRTIRQLIERIGRPIACHLVPTLYKPDSALAADILAALNRQFAGQVIPVVVREDEVVREAASFGQPVIEYAPESQARADFDELATWLEEHPPNPGVHIEVMPGVGHQGPTAGPVAPPADASGPVQGRAAELAERVRTLQGRSGVDDRPGGRPPDGHTISALAIPDDDDDDRHPLPAPEPAEDRPSPQPASRWEPAVEVAAPPASGAADEHLTPAPAKSRGGEGHASGPAEPDAAGERERPALPATFGVERAGGGVCFRQPGDGSCRVSVAGDFNNWSATSTPLAFDSGRGAYEAIVDLPPGRYRYRLVIDGCWQADPYNQHRQVNGYGELNSVLVVRQAAGEAEGSA